MKEMIKKSIVSMALFTSVSVSANNVPTTIARCTEDSLSPDDAKNRVGWALNCVNSNGGIFHGMTKNKLYSLVWELDFDTGTKTKKARPEYPTFGTPDLLKTWKAPIVKTASCSVPDGHKLVAYCTSSCYTPNQKLLFANGPMAIKKAYQTKAPSVVVLDVDATLDVPTLRAESVNRYVRSIKDTEHEILVFSTNNGPDLEITTNHPMVASNGKLLTANRFKVGDSFVMDNGEPAKITNIRKMKFYGKVYNIDPVRKADSLIGGMDLKGQIVIAQGYLSGSNWYQNSGLKYLHRSVFRQSLPKSLL